MLFKKDNSLWSIKLSVIVVAVFVMQMFISGFTEMFLLDGSAWTQPWRFVSAIFLHAGAGHILYNLFALIIFGLVLEGIAGSRRFLWVFFASGIIANLVGVLFYDSSLGASWAIFGIIGTLVVLRPGMIVWTFNLPMPMFVAGILWAFGDLVGAVSYFAGNPINNTGNIAHLLGMLFGLIYGGVLRARYKFTGNSDGEFRVDEREVRDWEERYMR